MLLTYNILAQHQEEYLNFVVNTFMPTLKRIGLENAGVWHTAYGDYPIRLLVFISESEESMRRALAGETWKQMEEQLKSYVVDYTCRIVPFQPGFQF